MSDSSRSSFPFRLLRFWTLRILPAWCWIALTLFLFQVAVCGIVHDNHRVKALLQLIDKLPPIAKAFMGGEILEVGSIAGLIAFGYQDPMVLILYMLYAVGVPTALLAGEVQKGTMELILSRQTKRTHIYVCAGLITVFGMFALVIVTFTGTVVATRLYHLDQQVSLYSFFKIAISGGMLTIAVGGIALLAAAFFRRGFAVSLTSGYVLLNYFVSIVANWWPPMKWLEPATIFGYVGGPAILKKPGWPIGDMCVLISLFLVTSVLGGIIWSRRDLPL